MNKLTSAIVVPSQHPPTEQAVVLPPAEVVVDAPQASSVSELEEIMHLHHTLKQIKAQEDKSREKAAAKRLQQHNKQVLERRQLDKEKLNAAVAVPALFPLFANLKNSPFLLFLMFVGFLLAQNTALMPLWGQAIICCAIYCSYAYWATIAKIWEITTVACQDIKSTLNKESLGASKEAKKAVPVSKQPCKTGIIGSKAAPVIPVQPDLSYNLGAFSDFTTPGQSVIVNGESEPKVTHYNVGSPHINIRAPLYINNVYTLAEIDTDSHLSLLSEQFYNKLVKTSEISYAKGPPETFKGMGGQLITALQPPLFLKVRIGHTVFTNTVFHVTKNLTTSDALLGTDFMYPQRIAAAPFEETDLKINWYITVGPCNNPTEKVPAYISNKISVQSRGFHDFSPFEIKRIKVETFQTINGVSVASKELLAPWPELQCHYKLKNSPYEVLEVHRDESAISVINNSLCPNTLCPSQIIKNTTWVQTVTQEVHMDPLLQTTELNDEVYGIDSLEPGIEPMKIIDKSTELDFIRTNVDIPEEFKQDLISFLEKIPDLYSGPEFSSKIFPEDIFLHDVELTTNLSGLHSRAFPVSGIRLTQLRENIDEMVKNKVLIPGDSPFTSPVFFVLKKAAEGKTASTGRLCFDYRNLNTHVKMRNFPLANLKNFFNESARFKVFCCIDIQNAFLSIGLTERAKSLLAIITPFGTYLPQRSPFGLKTSPSAFCYALDKVIGDLDFVKFYMDDLLIGADDGLQMVEHLKIVFTRLHKYNLKIRISKTKFFKREVKILGIIFSKDGKKVDPEKVTAIDTFPEINTVKKVQTFLGMLAYVSSFIPIFIQGLTPFLCF